MRSGVEYNAPLPPTLIPRTAKLLLSAVLLLVLAAYVSDALVYLHTTQKDGSRRNARRACTLTK